MDKQSEILVTSLVGLMTKEPLVQLEFEGKAVQLSPDEAHDLAISILRCAAASVADLFMVEFAMSKIGTDMNGAAHLLHEFREWRAAQEATKDPS